ncbi:MAG TPA: (Fe-S)-binding protein [Candidatus Lokiarchaeia archaeon]|nr:(Fe-S)-binding protein [Candidatus Lokiarchaeia archaeon]
MKFKEIKKFQRQMVLCSLCSNCSATCCSFKAFGWESYTPRARVAMTRYRLAGVFTNDAAYADRMYDCTMCKECDVNCSAGFSPWELFRSARIDLWSSGNALPALKPVNDNIIESSNVFGFNNDARGSWAEALDDVLVNDGKNLLFAGCIPAFKNGGALKKLARLYHAMDKPLTIIPGGEELCCGLPALDSGNVDLFNELMGKNIQKILEMKPERIVFACPSCYAFVNEYYGKENEDFSRIPLVFYTDDLLEGITAGQLALKGFDEQTRVTYHDPCHLGRFAKLWDSPREIIKQVPNASYVELMNCKEHTACCGSGGQLMIVSPSANNKVADKRIGEVRERNVTMLVNTCFTCQNTLEGAAFRVDSGDLEVVHILDLFED